MTTSGGAILALALAALVLIDPGAASAQETFTFAYLQRDDDPVYAPHRAYTGLILRDRQRPVDGAKVALRESRVLGRAMGLGFELIEVSLAETETAVAAIRALKQEQGISVFLLDLPLAEVAASAAALADEELLLFNIRHPEDALRGADCAASLFHTLPSHAMLMDALAQYLLKKGWTEVLVLEGERPADRRLSDAFQQAAKKFRLEVVDHRPFVLSNDPRERAQNNVPLLTGAADYDVIFLADSLGEFGRYVPYSSYLPRPVIGSVGLGADAWHWSWERHGAPQLNQRLDRVAGRRMTGEDWAAWAAVKAVVEAVVRSGATAPGDIRAFLLSDRLNLDTYKGAPGSFRAWDRQLRQAVLLHSHDAVIARAPIEGFLHEKNNLDTLGPDVGESECPGP